MSENSISKKELMELQKKFRSGEIKEEDIPKEQLEKLKTLYKIQIEFLEKSIEQDKKKIMAIKKEITDLQKDNKKSN